MIKFFKKNIFLIILVLFACLVFVINLRINIFRYNNFDYGKFDLGNMTQMVWNTINGRFMYLTDYFGTNLPRWSMSHVDPILLLFVPIFYFYQHPMTLVISQLILVIFSAVLVYKIAQLHLESDFAAFLLGLTYLLYPAVGFLTAWTAFHGVTVAIPFFFGAFYVFEKMHKTNTFTTRGLVLFWILLIITMTGKEQLPLYIFLYGIFIALLRNKPRLGMQMMVVGMAWFVAAFFIIIPYYAHYRVEGFEKFAKSIDIDTDLTRDVARPNYFLSRYAEFGDTYSEVIINMATRPAKLVDVFFGGDKLDNFNRTLLPLGYMPFAYPAIFVIAVPDFLINYLTTEGGIGTSEIYNHRVSMLIPVLFISTIYGIKYLADFEKIIFDKIEKNPSKKSNFILKFKTAHVGMIVMSLYVLTASTYTTYIYNNPVYLWMIQAVQKRIAVLDVFAKTDKETASANLKLGEVLRLSKLENNDRECANKVISLIPDNASVSGPDYMGAHLSMRETYAIFPALFNEADFVIVDVFSRKILTILEADLSLVRDVVADIVSDPNYDLVAGCGNLFVFQKIGPHNKTNLLPLQEKFAYTEKIDFPIFQDLNIVDYKIPNKITRGNPNKAQFVYKKRKSTSLDAYVLFMTFINNKTGEIYQIANLPSFSITQLKDWTEDRYYIEDVELALPKYLDTGEYKAFIGMSNVVRTRSIYLGDVTVD